VNKKSDMDLAAKGLGAKEWNNSLKTKLSLLPKKLFRIRMSRNFGMKMLTMTNLSTECLIQLTKLGYDATPDRKSGSAGMPRPISYAVSCLKKKLAPIRPRGSKRSSRRPCGRRGPGFRWRVSRDDLIMPGA